MTAQAFGIGIATAAIVAGAVAARRTRAAAVPRVQLSAMAAIGRGMFFDARLSGSGKLSCASCHDPDHDYGPPTDSAVAFAGVGLREQGTRAVPSLRYLDRIPPFGIGPDEPTDLERPTAVRRGGSVGLVPRGGFFWDGRASTLQDQAIGPLLNPVEMANRDVASLARTIRSGPYARQLAVLAGDQAIESDDDLIAESMFAIARFEVEDPSFHPYSSKYDEYLRGRVTLSAAERRGLAVFDDPSKGNCAACHLDRPTADGRPPAFSDFQYEALGVPRNARLAANQDPAYVDLGLCGPARADLTAQSQYCGMFRTPSLRNVANRRAFFHNGVFGRLEDVLAFYNSPEARPDLPPRFLVNIDAKDPPFKRNLDAGPPMTTAEMRDVIAFLGALSDGYSTHQSFR